MLYVGATRTEFCQDCEKHTGQVLEHLQKNGSGDPIAQVWRCIPGDHLANMHPGRVPPELEDLWEAS